MTAYIVGTGTIVNVIAILFGGAMGLLLRGRLKQSLQSALLHAQGVSTIFVGASGAMVGLLTLNPDGTFATTGALGMIISLVLGTLVGEIIDLEGKMDTLGNWLRDRAAEKDDNTFVEGFVTASLIVCVGAMAIVGSLEDALSHNPSTLYIKAMLDLVLVMIFASTHGKGAVFSALPVAVWQGGITMAAHFVAPIFTPDIIKNLSFMGAILVFCIGINITFGQKFRVANMLPALVFGAVYTALSPLVLG